MHPDEWPSPLPCPFARQVVAGAPITAEIELFAWHARFSVDLWRELYRLGWCRSTSTLQETDWIC
jgi:hypothetical protein